MNQFKITSEITLPEYHLLSAGVSQAPAKQKAGEQQTQKDKNCIQQL